VRPYVDEDTAHYLYNMIHDMKIMPSMRAMMTAGEAARRDNTCMYNCYYNAVDSLESFSEAMFILMCGTGVGFSVERQYISKLPVVPFEFYKKSSIYHIDDSKEGWAKAYQYLLESLFYEGKEITFDYSGLRPAGAPLKTFGGRSSGPEPLRELFNFTTEVIKKAKGRKLTSVECHDIMCKIGDIVVVGGVRRSALISLSNLSDDRMRHAKDGAWWDSTPYRALANNSAVYTEKPDAETFMREWLSLIESRSGERGIFNREAATKKVRSIGRRLSAYEWGTNPCSEIILRPGQFCNLTEVIVREDDTPSELEEKIRAATILGTIQSCYTHFPFLRDFIKRNTEEERLLGVSLTGILDREWTSADDLNRYREVAIETNAQWADMLNIPRSAAITCVKPSGTVSQLTDSASGIHPRHSEYYIRTVRGDNHDPMTAFMKAKGVPNEPCVHNPGTTTVFNFPTKSPIGSFTRNEMTAIEHLELWLTFADDWCEHKPSITVTVKEDEWVEVGAFVYKNFDKMSGVSFLPHSDHTYQQAPYQEITEEEYLEAVKSMPTSIDWMELKEYEHGDHTKSSQTFACTGDVCEIVDI
jgi:ribonucleoside-diphosphate reductase alpha chain